MLSATAHFLVACLLRSCVANGDDMGVSGPLVKYKVDSSAEGCTGLFWRVWSGGRFITGPNQRNPPWPRNGEIVEGRISDVAPGYLVLGGGLALPFHDAARTYTYLHPLEAVKTGLLAASGSAEDLSKEVFDALILGSGPAGLTAAIYLGRNLRSVLVVGGPAPGGALMLSQAVENFPPSETSSGSSIMGHLVKQAESFGAKFLLGTASQIALTLTGANASMPLFTSEMDDGPALRSRSVIVATGATERWLGLPGEEALRGVSLHTCAYCDARFYEGADVCVVGGGDGALEAAGYLARVANSVTLVHRRKSWKGSAAAAERISSIPSIRVLRPYVVEAWKVGTDTGKLAGAKLRPPSGGPAQEVQCSGAFIMIGREPQTAFLPREVSKDANGFILPAHYSMTSIPGLFAAGQVADGRYQQAVTAASAGAQAAMDVARWLDGSLDASPPAAPGVTVLRGGGALPAMGVDSSHTPELHSVCAGVAVGVVISIVGVRLGCLALGRSECSKIS